MTQYWGPCRITVDSVSCTFLPMPRHPAKKPNAKCKFCQRASKGGKAAPKKAEAGKDALMALLPQFCKPMIGWDMMGHDGTWWDMMGHGAPLGTWENSGFNLPNRQIYSKSDHLGQSSLVERSTVARQHTISSNCFCPSTWFAEVCELLCH